MAQKLEEFPGGPGKSKYPWDEWFDGSPWLLRRGEDYSTNTESFRAIASRAAKVEGKQLRTRLVKDEGQDAIAIQAY
ncbi:MAG: hypothetical protein ACTHN3_05115 [Solirubrobacterales bacterium]